MNAKSNIVYRTNVARSDMEDVHALHAEWFPVNYSDDFFESIVSQDDVVTVLAELESKIVGMATVAIRRTETRYNFDGDLLPYLGLGSPGDASSPRIAYILTLGVVDELRGLGIASDLLRQAIIQTQASDPSCVVIFLHVIEYNLTAMGLYEKYGFKRFKVEPNFYKLGETWYSGVMFYFPLMNLDKVGPIQRISQWIKRKLSSFLEFWWTGTGVKRRKSLQTFSETV